MSRNAPPLEEGQPFPALAAPSVAHGEVRLPDAITARRGVVLVYRAHW